MTPHELETILETREWSRLELKESFGAEAIETACAFANAEGGYIVLGVADDVSLAKSPLRVEALRDYENRIATATEPSVAVDAERVAYQGRDVVVLKVAENPLKPVAAKGRCYVRKGSVNHRMTPAEIAECHLKATGTSMDAVPVPGATRDDLDMEAVRRYMRKAVDAGRRSFAADESPWNVLLKLEWAKSETDISRAAYLLFAKDPQLKFPQATVHAGAFRDGGALILDSFDARGNIQDQIDATLAFVMRNIRRSIVVSAKAEHDRYWEYPLEALRETLTNAVCHRDYGAGNDIQVKIMEDRLVVHSPGLLPFDMTIERLLDPNHPSSPRNRLIAQAFYDMHLIEHFGSGIRRIGEDCRTNGNAFPEWRNEYGMFTTTYFPRADGLPPHSENSEEMQANAGKPNSPNPPEGINEGISEGINEGINGESPARLDESVLALIRKQPGIKAPALQARLGTSHASLERSIARLSKRRQIEHRGSKKAGGYYPLAT